MTCFYHDRSHGHSTACVHRLQRKTVLLGRGGLKEGKAFCLLSKLSHEKTVPIA